ncbi:MAG TPA: hypothetical protein PLQ04_08980 [Lachnospiraceae bacterium]|nr:hypothetical protein [Lachnospiraceae bacterium]
MSKKGNQCYVETEEIDGILYFANPEAALQQLLLDSQQYRDSEEMKEYQTILERSFEGEDE